MIAPFPDAPRYLVDTDGCVWGHQSGHLDPDAANELRVRYFAGEPRKDLAAEYGITVRALQQIARGPVRTWRRLKPHRGRYATVEICFPDGSSRRIAVHTLVLTTFVGRREYDREARYLNFDRSDLRLANLAWVHPWVGRRRRADPEVRSSA